MHWAVALVCLVLAILLVRSLRRPAPPPAEAQPMLPVTPPEDTPGWLRPAPATEVAAPELQQLGPYRILETLGEGAMATVYKAEDPEVGRPVALKVVRPDSEHRARFQREIDISRQLTHPNLVEMYFGGELDGYLCMAMEWVEGLTLEQILASGPLPLEDFPLLACQIASGLHFAHRLGVVHRDIKPSNIMVKRDGTVKLLDFGLALAEGQERFTVVGCTMGTPHYMAPEGLTRGVSDAFTDQYALGVVLYQMLAGRCPFEGDPLVVGNQHLKEPPPPLSQFRAGIPGDWEECILRMLGKTPQDRFEELSQVRRFLTTVLVEPT